MIATGGGMLVNPANRALHGRRRAGRLPRRAAGDDPRAAWSESTDRPLAGDWETLFEQRRAAYAAIPVHVDTTDKSPGANRRGDHRAGGEHPHGRRIPVTTPTSRYDIIIEPGRWRRSIRRRGGWTQRCAVITNTTLAPLYGERWSSGCPTPR